MKKQPRKTRRQLQAEKLATAQKAVNKANSSENPLHLIGQFQSYKLDDGNELQLMYNFVTQLSDEYKTWIFNLMERNMKDMYTQSSWGWDPVKKQEELTENTALYLIAKIDDVKVGFSHFRYDVDDSVDVLYCYELQLEEQFRRKGIGKFMMKTLEATAKYFKLQKVVLTVFKHNLSAIFFFNSLGYSCDTTNPAESFKMDYVILSKRC